MQIQRKFVFGSLLVFAAGLAYASDQTILGNSLTVKNPSTVNKRRITGKGKELASPNTIVGNPTVNGALLTIRASGGTPTTQTFVLAQGTNGAGKPFWTGDAVKGFKYKDPTGLNGAVKLAQIKKTAGGTFVIKVCVHGQNGTILVVPPNPGTSGCMLLSLTAGDTYSVQFGPTSVITNNGALLFKARRPTVEGTCVTTTTTTTTVTTSSTTTTTLYGSPSRAFVDHVLGLLD